MNEALHASVEGTKVSEAITAALALIDEQEAENEKLREALERIVRMAASEGWDWRSAKREFTLVAREALGDSRDLG
jgi:hypothetical protein